MRKLLLLIILLMIIVGCQSKSEVITKYSFFEDKSYTIHSNDDTAVIYSEDKGVMFIHYVPTGLYYYIVTAEGMDSMFEFKKNRVSIDQICSFKIDSTDDLEDGCDIDQVAKGKRIYANFLDKLDILGLNSTDIVEALDKILTTNYNTSGIDREIRVLDEFFYSKDLSEKIIKQIDSLEKEGLSFFYGDVTSLVNEEKEYIFAIRNDGHFLFMGKSMLVDPELDLAITVDSKCFYDYKLNQVIDNYNCSTEDIENGKASVQFMEETLSYLDYDLGEIKNMLLYVKDNKYSTTIKVEPIPTIYPTENPEEANNDKQEETVTTGQKNALKSAFDYLKYSSFSYKGLIDQLEFEGYTTEEATYAADKCGADWKKQAEKTAQSYLDYSSFSRQGLLDQLIFEGFTKEEAEHGVTAVGY